ncbi:MAG TPA: sodium:proton antiporter [Thermotogota bacterium]|nr:sodium:proton antiporter [Thermotogota bacterium]HRW93437.1 sodium:proton antiporter [Thermotogota bacterium]
MNVYTAGSILIFLLGLYGLLAKRDLFKMVISLSVLDTGVNLFLVAVGYGSGGIAPILTDTYPLSVLHFVDPLPQALVLTSIVINLGVTAFALVLVARIFKKHGTLDTAKLWQKMGGEEE